MKEIKLLNMEQVYFYIENGISPLRVECGFKNRIVFVFDKDSTSKLYGKWLENSHWKVAHN